MSQPNDKSEESTPHVNQQNGSTDLEKVEKESSGSLDSSNSTSTQVGTSSPDSSEKTKDDGDGKDPFEVTWEDGDNDPENPRSMPKWRKWVVVLILASSSVCVTCTSSMYTSIYPQIEPEFGVSQEVATLGLSLFVVGLGIGPCFTSPLSEQYGRKIIYIVSLALFLIWLVPCAVAQNIQTMLISRFFNGLVGSAFLSVAGGTVGDMFGRTELQAPMMIYTSSPFLGPEIGPIIGGFIVYYTTWRWTFYVLLIWTAVILLLTIFFVPETYHPVLLRRRAIKLRAETGDPRYKSMLEKGEHVPFLTKIARGFYRPLQLLVFEPMVLLLCTYTAIMLGIIYLFFGAFALIFSTNYGFNDWQVGLSFIGLLVGLIIGVLTDPIWHNNYLRLLRNYEAETGKPGASEPEFRLPPAMPGGILISVGLFIFGWTSYPFVPWIAPIIGSAVFAMGTLLLYSAVFTFLVDAYPLYAASALAANSISRSAFAAGFPLFGDQMYNNLGYQWATTLLALLALVLAPSPFILFKYGKQIRNHSRFAKSG